MYSSELFLEIYSPSRKAYKDRIVNLRKGGREKMSLTSPMGKRYEVDNRAP
jgi:hypothetical protein